VQSLWLSLEENSILTDTNICSFRQYIAQKFPTHSTARRATILADTIHRHINKYLPLLDENSMESLRIQLLKTASARPAFRIVVLDIFRTCIELSLGKIEIIQPLEQWLKLQKVDRSPEDMVPFTQLIQEAIQIQFQSQVIDRSEYELITSYSAIPLKRYQQLLAINIKQNRAILLIGLVLITLFLSANFNSKWIATTEPIMINRQSNLSKISASEEVISIKLIQLAKPHIRVNNIIAKKPILAANELTTRYSYTAVAKEPLRLWLIKQDSLLAEDPYLSTIMETALQYNIHPFLLIAIAGQEQSLVPQSHKNALKIVNNPFNVHHSWKDYNTDIADSSQIAAKTILHLVKGRPNDIQPLVWINRKYAEDSKWHLGVEAYFKQMLLLKDKSS
jgi:putative ABC transport system permease protein